MGEGTGLKFFCNASHVNLIIIIIINPMTFFKLYFSTFTNSDDRLYFSQGFGKLKTFSRLPDSVALNE